MKEDPWEHYLLVEKRGGESCYQKKRLNSEAFSWPLWVLVSLFLPVANPYAMHYLQLLFDSYREEETLLYEAFLIISYKSRLFLQWVSGYLPFFPLLLSASPILFALVTSCTCRLKKKGLLWETPLCPSVIYEGREVITHKLGILFILLSSSTL